MAKNYQHKLANSKNQLWDLMHGLNLFKVTPFEMNINIVLVD
jgi:hypothetical protein